MHILLTGGTGLIGRALCDYWHAQGHQLTVWSRSPERVAELCGNSVRGIVSLADCAVETVDAVVNLAGAPIADRPWTTKRRALLRRSRIDLTHELLAWLAAGNKRPEVLLSGSAVGWYGDSGDKPVDELQGVAGSDFAGQLCADWEAAAQPAADLGMRVVLLRTGLVLAREGGFLKRLLLPFRLGLGGRIGSGQQWMPWIHLHDQVALIDFLLRHKTAQGPYNACAPNPVRNVEFTKVLARVLVRPAFLPVPAALLKLGLGELAVLLLGGQQALPTRLLNEGFTFRFAQLDGALQNLLN